MNQPSFSCSRTIETLSTTDCQREIEKYELDKIETYKEITSNANPRNLIQNFSRKTHSSYDGLEQRKTFLEQQINEDLSSQNNRRKRYFSVDELGKLEKGSKNSITSYQTLIKSMYQSFKIEEKIADLKNIVKNDKALTTQSLATKKGQEQSSIFQAEETQTNEIPDSESQSSQSEVKLENQIDFIAESEMNSKSILEKDETESQSIQCAHNNIQSPICTFQDMVALINSNCHVKYCLNQFYEMGNNGDTQKRLNSDIETGHYQFKKDWYRDTKTGQFLFINKIKIAKQKLILGHLISKASKNILAGKSALNVSLPIEIFEPRSNLERIAHSYSFAPVLLKQAAESMDPVIQMKYAFSLLISSSGMYLSLDKPFNPILGETYQGRLDGYPFYCEQISHHPPIAAFLYKTDKYQIYGCLESIVSFHLNSISGINQGNVFVHFFNTDNCIGIIGPPGVLNGTMVGVRNTQVTGSYIAYDLKNKLVSEAILNPEKKKFFSSVKQPLDAFVGGVYSVTDKCVNKFTNLKNKKFKFSGLKMKEDVIEQVAKVSGIWNKEIIIDDDRILDFYEGELPFKLLNEINPIPSDCQYREDIIYLINGEIIQGNEAKLTLEMIQRNDKELRGKMFKKQK